MKLKLVDSKKISKLIVANNLDYAEIADFYLFGLNFPADSLLNNNILDKIINGHLHGKKKIFRVYGGKYITS